MSDKAGVRVAGDSLRRGSLINLGGAAATAVSNVLLVVITARLLAPGDAGRVFAVTSAFLIAAAVLRGGTPTGVVLFISRSGDDADQVARRISRLAVRPVVLAAATASMALLAGAVPIGAALGIGTVGVVVIAISLPPATALDTVLAVSRGQHDMAPTVLIDRVGRSTAQLALTGVAALSPSIGTLLAAWCLPYVGASVAAWLVTPGLRRANRPTQPAPPEETEAFVRFVIPRGIASIVQVCFARLDIVLVAVLAGPAEAAIYAAATRFVALCQFVQQAVASAGEPALAGSLARGQDRVALSIYRTTTVWLVALLWPVLLAVAFLAPEWLSVFGNRYIEGVDVVLVLALAMLVATGVGMVETVLNMAGRSGVLLGNNVFALVAMVALDLALIPSLGALGAALGWGMAIALKNLVPLLQLGPTIHGSPVSRSWLVATGLNLAFLGVLPVAAAIALGAPGRVAAVACGLVAVLVSYVLTRSALRLDRLFGHAPVVTRTVEATC